MLGAGKLQLREMSVRFQNFRNGFKTHFILKPHGSLVQMTELSVVAHYFLRGRPSSLSWVDLEAYTPKIKCTLIDF